MGLILAPVLALLKRVPWPIWVAVVALAWGSVQYHRASEAGTERLKLQAAQSAALEDAYRKALLESTRRIDAQKEATDAADIALVAAAAAAANANMAAGRVRDAAARAARRACDPAPAGPGAPASAPAVVLAGVLGRADARAGELAAAVDAARIAGQACERAYNSLTGR